MVSIEGDSVHIGVINIINEDGIVTIGKEKSAEKKTSAEVTIPDELNTEKAKMLWQIAIDNGWVDEQWQPLGLSLTESAILADELGAALKLKPRWLHFETLWNRKNIRIDFQKAYGMAKTADLANEMKTAFAKADNQ